MKWYKRDPDAAIAGMVGLTPEERGVYNTVIDLLYSRDGDLPTDDQFFARACECAPQMWRRIRDSLVTKGKLHFKTDGKLTANRVEKELKTARKLMENMSVLGEFSAKKRKENKEHHPTGTEDTTTTTTTTTLKKDISASNDAPRARRGSRLSDDWKPSPDDLNFCAELGVRADVVAREIEKFRDYWLARAGPGAVKMDWSRTWKNWIRLMLERGESQNGRLETDKDRHKRKYREALDKLRAFGEGRTNGDFSGEVVQLLPRTGGGGGP